MVCFVVVVEYCDCSFRIFSTETKHEPCNGRNIGNYEDDYKYMCVACQGYYMKKIEQQEYLNLLSVCDDDRLYHFDEELPKVNEGMINKLLAEVCDIENKYRNGCFVHDYDCVDLEEVKDEPNKDEWYIMHVHIEV